MPKGPKRSVGIVGSSHDEHAGYVAAAVERRGGEAVFIETDLVPEERTLTYEAGLVRYGKRPLDPLRCFYVKGVHQSLPLSTPEEINRRKLPLWQERYLAERERNAFLTSVLRSLHAQGRHFVNPVDSFDLHLLKLHQLELLRLAEVPVPETLCTNEPEAVRAFVKRHKGVIYKPIAGGAIVKRVEKRDLTDERLATLAAAPVLFQEQIPGDEYRCYVLGGEPVKAFKIPTKGVVDARQAIAKVKPGKLPAAGWEICLKGARALGLVFTAVDLRAAPDGRFVPLEYNPTPAISFFDDPVDGEVITRLAEHLLAHA